MRILISGSTGLIGRRVAAAARERGDQVTALVRSPNLDGVLWNAEQNAVGDVSGHDVVVHLAGENVASGRWNPARKERIRASRVDGTRLLCEAIAQADPKPTTLVCASAIGFYGDRGDEELDEDSAPGTGFFPDLCQAWESAAQPARAAGVRVVHLRIGIVLARDGGALHKMLLPFKLGLGGIVGSGLQYMSWISVDDVTALIARAIADEKFDGAYNATAPEPVTNREFTKALGRALGRPTIFPLPAFAARLMLGREMADALLLSSSCVRPTRTVRDGFEFRDPTIQDALRQIFSAR